LRLEKRFATIGAPYSLHVVVQLLLFENNLAWPAWQQVSQSRAKSAISPHVFDVHFAIRSIVTEGHDLAKITVRLELAVDRFMHDRELEKLAMPFAENEAIKFGLAHESLSVAIVKHVVPATLVRPPSARLIDGEEDCFVWWVLLRRVSPVPQGIDTVSPDAQLMGVKSKLFDSGPRICCALTPNWP
jgi:hypothetical protein